MLTSRVAMRKYLSTASYSRRLVVTQQRRTDPRWIRETQQRSIIPVVCLHPSPRCSAIPSTSACEYESLSQCFDGSRYERSNHGQFEDLAAFPPSLSKKAWKDERFLYVSRQLSPVAVLADSGHPEIREGIHLAQKQVSPRSPNDSLEKFPEGKPNWTQLEQIVNRLTLTLPYFFSHRQDLTFYRDDVILENRINGVTVRGVNSLWYNFATIRTLATFRYVFVELQPLNIRAEIDEGMVRVRWRVLRLGFIKTLMIWPRLGLRNWSKEILRKESDWFDGLAYYHVDCDGLVYRVVLDRMDVDRDKKVTKPVVVRKLAGVT